MTISSHRKLLGTLLVAAAAINIVICYGMVKMVGSEEFGPPPPEFFIQLVYIAVLFSALLYLFQAFAGYKVFRNGKNARTWGIVGSALALIGGITLPVGVYGIWLAFSQVDREDD